MINIDKFLNELELEKKYLQIYIDIISESWKNKYTYKLTFNSQKYELELDSYLIKHLWEEIHYEENFNKRGMFFIMSDLKESNINNVRKGKLIKFYMGIKYYIPKEIN